MEINENSILATMNPICLLAGIALVCLLAWFCVKRYCNTNDFKKSVQMYIPSVIALDVLLFFLLRIDIILCIGIDIFGFVALALISNYYFYH